MRRDLKALAGRGYLQKTHGGAVALDPGRMSWAARADLRGDAKAAIGALAATLVQPGQTLMSVVADTGVWITANMKETQLHDLRVGQPVEIEVDSVDGAVEASGQDAGTAAHYGDPVREQRALARGSAIVDLSHKGVVCVSGPDRLSWLSTLSSQILTGLGPGQSSETLFLSVQGPTQFAYNSFPPKL